MNGKKERPRDKPAATNAKTGKSKFKGTGLKTGRYSSENKFKDSGLKPGHYEAVYEMATAIAG